MILQGHVIMTVYLPEIGNDSPGLWNHCAVVSPRYTVIEAQEEPGCVIEVELNHFLKRYPEYIVYCPMINKTLDVSQAVAFWADKTIGAKYIRYDSYFNWFNGFNCVSLIDYAYRNAIGQKRKFKWRKPDDVVAFGHNHWQFVTRVNQSQTWVKPLSWFEGRIR